MLLLLLVLLFLNDCRAGSKPPTIWCSRVISTPKGPSGELIFVVGQFEGAYAKLKGSSRYVNMTIVSGQCYIDYDIVGHFCGFGGDILYINIDKVESFDSLTLYGTRAICTAVFAPECKFKAPNEGQLVPKFSFPLSKFVGENNASLAFAIKGNYTNKTQLFFGKGQSCVWENQTLIPPNKKNGKQPALCEQTKLEYKDGLLQFNFTYPYTSQYEAPPFTMRTNSSELTLSVDFSSSGESPEVAGCKSNSNGNNGGKCPLCLISVNFINDFRYVPS
ncbi:unnamed protein product [Hymenolepis diminuta]|uniref:DUF5727 domain-containing protein n=1 Tax=Hymenolepis diminuta TaxID=6216 RepID=A0A564ZAU3_HYMDI|nr:unnamed protein product [Hymenolepis diminuta]